MADTLLFRGGSTADTNSANTTVADREIVIDTDTDEIVVGSAKKRTIMNGNDITIDSSGNVGIGTTSPAKALEIFRDSIPCLMLNDGDQYKSYMQLAGNDLEIRGSSGVMEFYTGSADGLSSTERMRIDSSGNVKIIGSGNVSAPKIALNANGSITAAGRVDTGALTVDSNLTPTSGENIEFFYSSGGYIQAYDRSNSAWKPLRIKSSNYEIGLDGSITAASTLFIKPDSSESAQIELANSPAGGILYLRTANSVRKIEINGATGSAEFAGTVEVGPADVTSNTANGVRIINSGSLSVQRQSTQGSSTVLSGFQGNTNTTSILANGNATFTGTVTAANITSDIRFKENIADANPQLADVVALGSQLKNWNWTDDAPLNDELRAKRFLGLVAQEAEKVCPDVAYSVPRTKQGAELTPETTDEEGNVTPATYEELDDSYKAIKHDVLIMKLLGAVAELSAKVEALESA